MSFNSSIASYTVTNVIYPTWLARLGHCTPWLPCCIIYPTWLVRLAAMCKSGLSNHKEWIITFKPWLLPRIQGWVGYIYAIYHSCLLSQRIYNLRWYICWLRSMYYADIAKFFSLHKIHGSTSSLLAYFMNTQSKSVLSLVQSTLMGAFLVAMLLSLLCPWHEHTNSPHSRFLYVVHNGGPSSFNFLVWNSS